MSSWVYTACLFLVAGMGFALAWVVYRHEQAFYTGEDDIIHPEKVIEVFFYTDESAGYFFLYELIKTREGYIFRCSDALSEEVMWEGSGRLPEEAIREASWESLRKALEE